MTGCVQFSSPSCNARTSANFHHGLLGSAHGLEGAFLGGQATSGAGRCSGGLCAAAACDTNNAARTAAHGTAEGREIFMHPPEIIAPFLWRGWAVAGCLFGRTTSDQ